MWDLIKRNRLLVSASVVLLALVILLSLRGGSPTTAKWLDETLQTIAYPFQSAFYAGKNTTADLFDNYTALINLKQENERLVLRMKALEEELNHYINSSVQFNMLREQLRFLEEDPEKKVFAEVIGESMDAFHHVLLINKGRQAGIRRNFPVVLREGVVGRVQSATALQSVVQLIVDRRHRFPVLIQRSRERMTLRGEGGTLNLQAQDRGVAFGLGEAISMNRIRMLADVEKGDRVISSGLAGIFPKGLLVGTVTDVSRARHELFQTAEIEPAVDFNKIEGVFVILRNQNSPDFPVFTSP